MLASENTSSSLCSSFVSDDAALPGLITLLDPVQAQAVVQSGVRDSAFRITDCRAQYIRYKPATNCLVSYLVTLQDSASGEKSELRYYGKAYTATDYSNAAEKTSEHRLVSPAGVPSVVTVDEKSLIFYLNLNDRSLPGLRALHDARKLVRLLHDILPGCPRSEWRISDKKLRTTLIRYKPEKRAVSRIESRLIHKSAHRRADLDLYVRSYCDDRGADVFVLMNRLGEALKGRSDLLVPNAVAYQREARLLFMETLEGVPMNLSAGSHSVAADVSRAGGALARLHELSQVDLPVRTVDALLQDAKATGDTLKHLIPRLGSEVSSVLDGLEQLAAKGRAKDATMVHGDFYYDQVLLRDQGEAILDFDRSYRGESLADIGNFCAHLHLLGLHDKLPHWKDLIGGFIKQYEAVSGRDIDQERLRFWTAFSLVLLSVSPFRTVQPDWQEQAEAVIDVCREMLS